jgi:ABC-type transporter Mla subunit MlaD
MISASVKYLGAATLLALAILPGCRTSDLVIHKDGAAHVAREAVEPITRSLDEQTDKIIEELRLEELTYELRELVKTTNESIKTGEKTVEQLTESLQSITALTDDIRVLVNNLEETRGETTELIKTARELVSNVNLLMPEVTKLLANVNELVEEAKNDLTAGTSETTPAWMKILPYILYGIGALVVILILVAVFKRKKK